MIRRLSIVAMAFALAACGPADMDGEANTSGSQDTSGGSVSKAEAEAELMRLEREFSAASVRDGATAWSSRWAANGRHYSGEGDPGIGPDTVLARMTPFLEQTGERFTWWPDTAVVAASGDLGYTLGQYAITGEAEQAGDTIARGHYVTVWQKQADGSWKIAVDIGT